MDGDGRDAALESAVENGEELFAAFRRVVQAAAHFDRDRNVRRHGFAHSGNDFQRRFHLAQQKSATATAEHFFHRAAEIDVDHVEARGHQALGRGGEIVGIGAHQLPADGMLFVGDVQPPLMFFSNGRR